MCLYSLFKNEYLQNPSCFLTIMGLILSSSEIFFCGGGGGNGACEEIEVVWMIDLGFLGEIGNYIFSSIKNLHLEQKLENMEE